MYVLYNWIIEGCDIMNRKTRNIIMIIALIVLIAGTVFTVFHKERVMYGSEPTPMGQQGGFQGGPGMTPPETPEGVPEGTTPPQPPGMDQQSGQNGQTPPATPEGVPEGTTPPQPPGMNGGQQPGMQPGMNQEIEMPTYFYYIFGAEGLGISLILIYLIMSQMNKKSAKYVFSSSSKKMAYIVMSLALTAIITIGCSKIELPKQEPAQPLGGPQAPGSSVAASSINELF